MMGVRQLVALNATVKDFTYLDVPYWLQSSVEISQSLHQ